MTAVIDEAPEVETAVAPRRTWLLLLTAMLVVAAAGLGFTAQRAQTVADARQSALSSAEKRIPALLTYRHTHLEEDLARAAAQTSSGFRAEYRSVLDTSVQPIAARDQVDNTATVSGVGIVRATRDRVVVLAFITQSTTKAGGAPVTSGSRAEVSLERGRGDAWLISALKPV